MKIAIKCVAIYVVSMFAIALSMIAVEGEAGCPSPRSDAPIYPVPPCMIAGEILAICGIPLVIVLLHRKHVRSKKGE